MNAKYPGPDAARQAWCFLPKVLWSFFLEMARQAKVEGVRKSPTHKRTRGGSSSSFMELVDAVLCAIVTEMVVAWSGL